MNELEKLKRLPHHWQEHNDEHAEAYRDWAEKAVSLGHQIFSQSCVWQRPKGHLPVCRPELPGCSWSPPFLEPVESTGSLS